jgi:vancomycin resistance protein YoaR
MRFIFNDDTRQLELIQPAIIGRGLDVDLSLQQINQVLLAGQHTVNLVMQTTNPPVTDDATAESLGITELTSAHTSYFYGSSTSRKQNIETAASRFHGLLVAPGETFSMADALGDVSLDTGYAEALIIFGDRTIQGVGGGVCQVSTTLFRTVFFGGYQVDAPAPCLPCGIMSRPPVVVMIKTWLVWMPPCSPPRWTSVLPTILLTGC